MSFGTITGNAVSAISHGVSSFRESLLLVPTNQSILISIATIIIVAAIFAFILRALKQELIPAYILTGVIIGPLILGLVKNTSLIAALAEMGIAFLLFVAGLEISASKLKETSSSLIIGLLQIIVIGAATFFISQALGFAVIEAAYLAFIIAFSSTIIVVKVFADNRELNTLHARIAVGILVLQDFAAIVALAILSSNFSGNLILIAIIKIALIMSIAYLLNKTLLGPIFKFASTNTELLFIVSIAFVLSFAALAYFLNLSIVIGAFIAGIALANLPYKLEIESKIKPLHDFFAIIFFVSLGMWLTSFDISKELLLFVLLFVMTILIKPFIVTLFARIFGYKTRTSILAGLSLGQLSEFSLILALQGLMLGILTQTTFDMVVLIAIITMALTPYLIKVSTGIYNRVGFILGFLDGLPSARENLGHCGHDKQKSILLFGCHRMGTIFLKAFGDLRENMMVIDYNPDIIHALTAQHIACVYGDTMSREILHCVPVKQAKIAISTIPEVKDNILLIERLKAINPKIFVLVTAEKIHDALKLYDLGADYVLLPQVISGEKGLSIVRDVEKISKNKDKFSRIRSQHIAHLKDLHRFLY